MNVRDSISVYSETSSYAFIKTSYVPSLRISTIKFYISLFLNFFFFQHKSAFLPGRVPVTNVDHPLDKKIPFTPSWIKIYIDFAKFWIRMLSFILRRYGRKAYAPASEFIAGMADLYTFAAVVYRKNLSTTTRPFYIKRPLFMVIHMLDPHLMCIPSLHVMVVIYTYTAFAKIIKSFGDEDKLKEQILEMKYGALAIIQAILFVKQHSINCIAAALYAMCCYRNDLFPQEEAEKLLALIFSPIPDFYVHTKNVHPSYAQKTKLPDTALYAGFCRRIYPFPKRVAKKLLALVFSLIPDFGVHTKNVHPSYAPKTKLPDDVQNEIKEHILNLFRRFLSEGKSAKSWDEPLLKFLK